MADQQNGNEEATVPSWIEKKVLTATQDRVKSLHLLKEKGMRKSALLFTDQRAFVADKGTFRGVKMYEVPYPEGLLINASLCPHCSKPIREPVRKVSAVKGGATRTLYEAKPIPVEEIEGIGETIVGRLRKGGINTTGDLLAANPARIAKLSEQPMKNVTKWCSMAELMQVPGIGKQYAEALVRSGVRGIDDLKNRKAEAIAADVSRYLAGLDNKVLGQAVSEKRVATWQREAAGMRRVRQPVPEA